jgi:hypothetical protein
VQEARGWREDRESDLSYGIGLDDKETPEAEAKKDREASGVRGLLRVFQDAGL